MSRLFSYFFRLICRKIWTRECFKKKGKYDSRNSHNSYNSHDALIILLVFLMLVSMIIYVFRYNRDNMWEPRKLVFNASLLFAFCLVFVLYVVSIVSVVITIVKGFGFYRLEPLNMIVNNSIFSFTFFHLVIFESVCMSKLVSLATPLTSNPVWFAFYSWIFKVNNTFE